MTVMDALVTAWEANPEATESMIDDIVGDLLADDRIDNAELFDQVGAAIVGQKVGVAKRALLRQYASDISIGHYPDEEVHKAAEWLSGLEAYALEVVRKDSEFERKHKRGFGGRFVRGVNQSRTVNATGRTPEQQAHPVRRIMATPAAAAGTLPSGVTQDRLDRTQAQYEQANEILAEFGGAFSAQERGQIDAIIQYKEANGDVKSLALPLDSVSGGLTEEAYGPGKLGVDTDILSIQVDAGENSDPRLLQRVSNFNAAGAAGGSQFAALMNMPAEKRTAMTEAFMPRRPDQSRLKTLFGRMKAGGDVLEATGNPKMAELARFMGTYGPEATDVLEPRVRQAAYRYRGTEKEPDINLMRHMNSPDMTSVEAVAREGGYGPATEALMKVPMNQATPVIGSAQYNVEQAQRSGESLTEDQLNMRVRSDVAAMHLMQTIPLDRRVAELSRRSGNILPSQGVIIDADGDVVSQSVGVGDDTYLPFDYTNMKRSMRGGQYVRTRVQGGLTGEDIAAAVGNGARMATVVSSSGVHSIEFDPNLRGARANTDKAREMYRRYIQILDAVEGSGMYAQDIDPREKAKLRARAEEISGDYEGENFKNVYRKLENEARAKATRLTSEEIDGLMAQAESKVNSDPRLSRLAPERKQRVINDEYKELEEKASSEKVNRLRLNAEGYQVALQTLQQQFPYFIRNVSYEPLADTDTEGGFLNNRGQQPTPGRLRQRLRATDEGYMAPGGIKASSTPTGFYRTQEAHETKQAIAERLKGGGGGGGTTPPSGPGLTGPTGGPEGGLMGSVGRLRNQAVLNRNESLTELQNVFSTLGAQRVSLRNHPAGQQWDAVKDMDNQHVAAWFMNQENPRKELEDPAKAGRLATALSDRKAVASAFNIALQSGAGADFFAGGGTFGGHKDAQSAANYVADLATKVVDSDLVTQPFVNPQTADGDPFHAGQRPQALKINGMSVNDITNTQQLNAVLQQNPDVADLARKIGTLPGGDGYQSAAAVAQDVSERVAVLRDLGDIIADAKKDPDRATGLARGAGLYVANKTANPAKFMETLTRMNDGRPVNTAEDLIALERKWPDTKREALKHQQAWALVNAGRAVGMVEGGDVSGGPKAAGRLQVEKADQQGGSTRPARPVLQVVRKEDSPLAREISRRRAAGLPFVPEKVGAL